MNKSVYITDIAKEDITKITEYIAVDNKGASVKIVDDFYKVFELLSKDASLNELKIK